MASGTKLHDAVRHDRCRLISRIVSEGTPVDALDASGSSALFVAITEGVPAAVPHLLAVGADPNLRCADGATPVHAACRRGSRALLQQLLEYGGDLRLRDAQGRTPQDWAMGHADPQCRRKLLAFINTKRALAYRFGDAAALLEEDSVGAGGLDGTPSGSSAAAASLRRRFGRPTPPRRPGRPERIRADGGFGVVYCSPGRETGVSTLVPFVASNYLYNSEESAITWCGPQSLLQTMYWDKLKVSVKKSSLSGSHTRGRPCSDILITELEKIRLLTYHPYLLWPLAVSPVQNMDDVLLVFECVHFGSLFDVLHTNTQYAVGGPLTHGRLLLVLQQVCEALLFLHSRRWVHGCISSHCIYVVTPCLGKLGNFEFVQRSEEESGISTSPGEEFLDYYYHWMAPEVLAGGRPTFLSDLYQFCAVLWELFAEQVPWGSADRATVERALTQERRGLSRRSEIPPPLDTLVHGALAPEPADRDATDLEDVYQALAAAAHDEGGVGFAVGRAEQQPRAQHAGDGARTKSAPGRPCRQASTTEVDHTVIIHRAPTAAQRRQAASTVADMSDLEELISLADEDRVAAPGQQQQLRSTPPPPRRPFRGSQQPRDTAPSVDLLGTRFDQVSLSSSMDPMDFAEAPKTPTFSARPPERPSFEACTQTEPEVAPPLRPRTRGFVPCTSSATASMRSAFTNTLLADTEVTTTTQSTARPSRTAAAMAEPVGSGRRNVRPSKPAGHSYGVSPFIPSNRLLMTGSSILEQQRTVADSSGPDSSRVSTQQPWRARSAVVESRYRQQAVTSRGTSVCRVEDAILEGLEDGDRYHRELIGRAVCAETLSQPNRKTEQEEGEATRTLVPDYSSLAMMEADVTDNEVKSVQTEPNHAYKVEVVTMTCPVVQHTLTVTTTNLLTGETTITEESTAADVVQVQWNPEQINITTPDTSLNTSGGHSTSTTVPPLQQPPSSQ